MKEGRNIKMYKEKRKVEKGQEKRKKRNKIIINMEGALLS